MVLHGHIRNGMVVLDRPADLPEGAAVRVEVIPSLEDPHIRPRRREGGQWRGRVVIAADFDVLPDDLAEAFGIKTS